MIKRQIKEYSLDRFLIIEVFVRGICRYFKDGQRMWEDIAQEYDATRFFMRRWVARCTGHTQAGTREAMHFRD